MNDLVIFALLFVAIAIGWFLGRRSSTNVGSALESPSRYYQGLDDILDGRPDAAIDAFINGLEVSSETVETHFALGAQLRRKGEVGRAVRVHQNLLSGPALPADQLHQAHLELARDYISAGLLDRAEQLLLGLVEDSPGQRIAAQRHLLELYEIEREWQRAIEVASQLLPRKSLFGEITPGPLGVPGQQITVALAHYYCELACEAFAAGNLARARELLEEAMRQDRHCTRASIMLGEVEFTSGRFKAAVSALRRVREQDPDHVPETIGMLRKCYGELAEEGAVRAYLRECLASRPTASLVVAIAEDILASEGSDAAAGFLATQLTESPSLGGLARLIDLQANACDDNARANLQLLKGLVGRLLATGSAYRCGHCGFSGRHLHWNCPGCKHWGSIKMIAGSSF